MTSPKTSTTQTTVYDPLLGVEVVVLHPAVLAGFSDVLPRGASFFVTAKLVEDSMDRNGVSWLRYLDDADAQQRAFGTQMIARANDQAEPIRPWVRGDAAWAAARSLAREEIISSTAAGSQARRAQLDALEAEFGPAPQTSAVMADYAGSDGKFRGDR
jgi:hypothetical protein